MRFSSDEIIVIVESLMVLTRYGNFFRINRAIYFINLNKIRWGCKMFHTKALQSVEFSNSTLKTSLMNRKIFNFNRKLNFFSQRKRIQIFFHFILFHRLEVASYDVHNKKPAAAGTHIM